MELKYNLFKTLELNYFIPGCKSPNKRFRIPPFHWWVRNKPKNISLRKLVTMVYCLFGFVIHVHTLNKHEIVLFIYYFRELLTT